MPDGSRPSECYTLNCRTDNLRCASARAAPQPANCSRCRTAAPARRRPTKFFFASLALLKLKPTDDARTRRALLNRGAGFMTASVVYCASRHTSGPAVVRSGVRDVVCRQAEHARADLASGYAV